MIEQAFEVATEFRFDIGQAMINTNALKSSVDDLSHSADGALNSLNYLAGGLVTRLGFGSGGLLSMLTKAVEISQEFDIASLGFANNIMENFGVLSGTITTFNDRLRTSEMIMNNISETAATFGLSTAELAGMTNRLATPLAQRGKLGNNYGNAIGMSKNLMLASSNLGINPGAASESLYRALSEHQPLHGQLFTRLANTPQFHQAHITTQGQLQNMNTDKKIDLLSSALEHLAMDADALGHRLNQIRVQFIILKDRIAMTLKPIGDAIQGAVVKVFQGINAYLKQNGPAIGKAVGKLISGIFDNPQDLLTNLLQLKHFGKDFKAALHLTELYGIFKFISFILGTIGITFNGGLLKAIFMSLWEGFQYVWALIPVGAILRGVFRLISTALTETLPIFMSILFVLQVFSRAMAIAHINDATAAVALLPRFLEAIGRLKDAVMRLLAPIFMAIDGWAQMIAPLFEWSLWMEVAIPIINMLATGLEFCAYVMTSFLAVLNGVTAMIIGFMFDIKSLKNPFSHVIDNFTEGYTDFMDKHAGAVGKDLPAPNVTNNNHIEARFDMREQLEPDRIAFAVTEHLKNLAINPKQGRGNSTRGGVASATFAGARAGI